MCLLQHSWRSVTVVTQVRDSSSNIDIRLLFIPTGFLVSSKTIHRSRQRALNDKSLQSDMR